MMKAAEASYRVSHNSADTEMKSSLGQASAQSSLNTECVRIFNYLVLPHRDSDWAGICLHGTAQAAQSDLNSSLLSRTFKNCVSLLCVALWSCWDPSNNAKIVKHNRCMNQTVSVSHWRGLHTAVQWLGESIITLISVIPRALAETQPTISSQSFLMNWWGTTKTSRSAPSAASRTFGTATCGVNKSDIKIKTMH